MILHVFKVDHWHWTSNLCAFPWLRPPLLPSAFLSCCSSWCRVEASWTFPVHFGIVTGFVLTDIIFGVTCWWDFMGTASDVSRRHNLTTKPPILWLLQSFFSTLLLKCPLSLNMWEFCRCFHLGLAPQLCILTVVVFCSGLSLLQRSFLDGVEDCTYLWI